MPKLSQKIREIGEPSHSALSFRMKAVIPPSQAKCRKNIYKKC